MTVVRGIIREIGRSKTTQVMPGRWHGSTNIIVQDEKGLIYSVHLSARTMEKCRFLPRVGMKVILHGFVEEAEYGLSDFIVTRVTDIKHEGAGIKRILKFDDED